MIRAISPTMLSKFEQDRKSFVLTYILDLPRQRQTRPMAIGSAFDAYVKSYLAAHISGKKGWFPILFEAQVEHHNRDWAFENVRYVFQEYKNSGALRKLLTELEHANSIMYEFDAHGKIVFEDGFWVPIGGKPDLFFILKDGINCVYDWKVNGFCSTAHPAPHYIRLMVKGRDRGAYKDIIPLKYHGIPIHMGGHLDRRWRDQLYMYAMMIGLEKAETWIMGVEQLAFSKGELRCAAHRVKGRSDKVMELRSRLRRMWEAIQSQHYFTELSFAESQRQVDILRNNSNLVNWVLNS